MNRFNFTERVFGSLRHTNEFLPITELNTEFKKLTKPVACYYSSFLFPKDVLDYVKEKETVSGYPGECFTKFIRFDIDRSDSENQQDNIKNAQADAKQLIERLRNLGVKDEFIRCYFTGKKGFNVEISSKLFGLEPSENLNEVVKSIALKIADGVDVDAKIYDKVRLFRIPNSIHEDTGLYKIPLTVDELFSHDEIEIIDLATSRKPFPKSFKLNSVEAQDNLKAIYLEAKENLNKPSTPTTPIDLSSPPANTKLCYWKILNEGVDKTNPGRHVAALRLAKFLKLDLHYTDDICFSILQQWDNKNRPPLQTEGRFKEKDITNLMSNSIKYNYGCNDPLLVNYCDEGCFIYKKKDKSETEIFTPGLSLPEFVKMEFPERERVIDGLLHIGGTMFIQGGTGIGKSILCLNLGLNITTGEPFLGIFNISKQRPVLYIQEQVWNETVQDRAKLIASELDADNFIIKNKPGIKIDRLRGKKYLKWLIKYHEPEVVIVDTFSDIHNQPENDNDKMKIIMDTFDEINIERNDKITWIFIHHTGKPTEWDKQKGAYRGRGASIVPDRTNTTINMVSFNVNMWERGFKLFKLEFSKIRDFPPQDPIIVSLNPENLWFEHHKTIEGPKVSAEDAVEILREIGEPINKEGLKAKIGERFECARPTASSSISKAIEVGLILEKKRGTRKMLSLPGWKDGELF
jgi:RecA-family ATPase